MLNEYEMDCHVKRAVVQYQQYIEKLINGKAVLLVYQFKKKYDVDACVKDI
jgi:hypothetical protein